MTMTLLAPRPCSMLRFRTLASLRVVTLAAAALAGRTTARAPAFVQASSPAAASRPDVSPRIGPAEVVPFDSERWSRAGTDAELVEHLGRESLLVRSGVLLLDDVKLRNCVIEVDIALPAERGFMGVVWRVQGPRDYEQFYLRSHQSGNPDACQYTPVIHGLSGWQLYAGPGHCAAIPYSTDRWTQVKVVVWEGRAEMQVDSETPRVTASLKRDIEAGAIGLSVAAFAPAHFSNFRYRVLDESPFTTADHASETTPGVVPSWFISSAFAEAQLLDRTSLGADYDAGLTWTALPAEATGLANLSHVQGISPGRDTCYARVRMASPREQTALLSFGFSDRARVYLNGRLLYAGDNGYRTRDYRFLGTMGYFDRLALPLQKGTNELVFAVSESFGGWGVQARFGPGTEIEFE